MKRVTRDRNHSSSFVLGRTSKGISGHCVVPGASLLLTPSFGKGEMLVGRGEMLGVYEGRDT